jgi:hypothetical protein
MSHGSISAVLFAKDHRAVAEFHRRVVDASVSVRDEYHTLLDVHGFRLAVHQIPSDITHGLNQPPSCA